MSHPTSIRLPDDVRRQLRKCAKAQDRRLAALIVMILKQWLKRQGKVPSAPAEVEQVAREEGTQ